MRAKIEKGVSVTLKSSEVHLISRPVGTPTSSDFAVVERTVQSLAAGEILVRNDWMSVDPYMRGRMNDTKSYVPPFALGQAMDGAAVGTVIESRSSRVPEGAVVRHGLGWRTYAVIDADAVEIVDVSSAEASAYLGLLGVTGFTAYVALTVIAPVEPRDVVFISGAAGGVGVAAGVIAKKLGASAVIGSAGGRAKVERLGEFGYDKGIDYKAGSLSKELMAAAPDGVDVYLDNVGGEHLQVAIDAMNDFGRIALCGAISQYNNASPQPGPSNLLLAVGKRLRMRGFIIMDHRDLRDEFMSLATEWLADGSISNTFTAVEGLDNAADALLDLANGGNIGKMLVRLSAG